MTHRIPQVEAGLRKKRERERAREGERRRKRRRKECEQSRIESVREPADPQ